MRASPLALEAMGMKMKARKKGWTPEARDMSVTVPTRGSGGRERQGQ
jgi:hypothetical protein